VDFVEEVFYSVLIPMLVQKAKLDVAGRHKRGDVLIVEFVHRLQVPAREWQYTHLVSGGQARVSQQLCQVRAAAAVRAAHAKR
jgi:hypothetical protein